MSDLINRNDALEIIQSMYPGIPRVPWLRKDWQERYEPYIRAEKAIRGLPSAQPEIIRCRDCRHFEYNHPYIIQSVPVLGHDVCNAWGDGCKTDENGYCFLAERRTDDLQ